MFTKAGLPAIPCPEGRVPIALDPEDGVPAALCPADVPGAGLPDLGVVGREEGLLIPKKL